MIIPWPKVNNPGLNNYMVSRCIQQDLTTYLISVKTSRYFDRCVHTTTRSKVPAVMHWGVLAFARIGARSQHLTVSLICPNDDKGTSKNFKTCMANS